MIDNTIELEDKHIQLRKLAAGVIEQAVHDYTRFSDPARKTRKEKAGVVSSIIHDSKNFLLGLGKHKRISEHWFGILNMEPLSRKQFEVAVNRMRMRKEKS